MGVYHEGVRTATTDTGTLEDRYEYDAFGQPYKGDLSGGMNLGYTGKPYDPATGLYNYGYRDYKPQAARFTTIDPIRDGNNWFAYVNNDPVNWRDPWGLAAVDQRTQVFPTDSTRITNTMGPDHPYGIDVGAVNQGVPGDPIYAPVGGTIITAGIPDWSTAGIPYVVIQGDDGREHRLGHPLIPETTQVGNRVEAGQQVATMSDQGSPGRVHLHYDVIGPNGRENPLDLY
jgi:RHS repeat-associated protein